MTEPEMIRRGWYLWASWREELAKRLDQMAGLHPQDVTGIDRTSNQWWGGTPIVHTRATFMNRLA